jgi:hypothetical protein
MSNIPTIKVQGYNNASGGIGTLEATYGPAASMWQRAPLLEALQDPGGYHLFRQDFYHTDNTNEFTLVTDAGGTAAVSDIAGGVLTITNHTTDNDESYLSSKTEAWKFAADKPLWFEARVKASADNMVIGLSDTVGANFLQDTGAGPATSFDGAVFFRGETATWQFETSNATTQVTNADVTDTTTDTYIRLGFIFDPNDGTTGTITPVVNGVVGSESDAHSITLSGLEEMHIVFGCKNAAGVAATLLVDYVQVLAVR